MISLKFPVQLILCIPCRPPAPSGKQQEKRQVWPTNPSSRSTVDHESTAWHMFIHKSQDSRLTGLWKSIPPPQLLQVIPTTLPIGMSVCSIRPVLQFKERCWLHSGREKERGSECRGHSPEGTSISALMPLKEMSGRLATLA